MDFEKQTRQTCAVLDASAAARPACRVVELALSTMVVVAVLFCFGMTIYFLSSDLTFDMDDATIQTAIQNAKSLTDLNQNSRLGGIFSRWCFYQLYTSFDIGIHGRKRIAAAISFLVLCYTLYICRKYNLFRTYTVLLPVAVLATNSPFIAFSTYGWFTYPLGIFFSAGVMHVALFLSSKKKLSPINLAVLALLLATVVFLSVRFILPVIILLGSYCAYCCLLNIGSWKNMGKAILSSFIVGLPAAIVAGVMLRYSAHPQFREPRPNIQMYYFPLTNLPESLQGAWLFFLSRTARYLHTTFAPFNGNDIHEFIYTIYVPDWTPMSKALAVFFVIGIAGSLIQFRRPRFLLGLYVLLTWCALSCLGVLGLYAYGHVRYTLFILVPMLVMAALGIEYTVSVLGWIASHALARLRLKRIVPAIAAVLFVVPSTYVVRHQSQELSHTRDIVQSFNSDQRSVLATIDSDTSDAFVCDHFTANLLKLRRPDFSHPRMFKFSPGHVWHYPNDPKVPLGDWHAFLDQHDTFIVLTYRNFSGYGSDYTNLVNDFFNCEVLHAVRRWNLLRFTRLPVARDLAQEYCAHWALGDENGRSTTGRGAFTVLSLDENGSRVCQAPVAVSPGSRVVGEATLWSAEPVRVGLSVEATPGASAGPREGTQRWHELSDIPTRYRVTHVFDGSASGLTLRFQAPEDRGATFKIRDISLGCIDSGE